MPSKAPEIGILTQLRANGSTIRQVRFRDNRVVLLSVSRDGRTLNCHACFREAPPGIVEAIADAVTAPRAAFGRREALRRLREWEGTRAGLERARGLKAPRNQRVNTPETAPLRSLFLQLNLEKFGGRLPEIPLRLSRRMTRSLGTVRYSGVREGNGADPAAGERAGSTLQDTAVRSVKEIAISADLLGPSKRSLLEDTMLHEMAHAEAWIRHGHRGHGRVWKTIARRVGCRPYAVNDVRVTGRRQ